MRPFVRKFSTYFLFDALNKAFPFLLLPIIAKYLTTSEFGIVSNFLAFYQVVQIFIVYSTYTKLSTEYYNNKDSIRTLFSNLIYLMIFSFVITSIIVLIFNHIIESALFIGIKWQIVGLLTALFASVTMLYTTLLMMQGKAIQYGIIQNTQSFLLFILTVVLVALIPMKWEGRILAQFLAFLCVGALVLYLSWHHQSLLFEKIDKRLIKSVLLWGAPLLPHTLSYWIKSGLDKVIVTGVVGLSVNGIYSLSLTLGSIMSLVSTSFFNVYSPYCYKLLHQYDQEKMLENKKKILFRILKYNGLYFVLFTSLSVLSYFVLLIIIPIFFSNDYVLAIKYLPFVLLTNVIYNIYTVNSVFLFYRNKTKLIGTITISSSLLQVLLNLVLIHVWGIYGVLISGILVAIVISLLVTYNSFKVYHIKFTK